MAEFPAPNASGSNTGSAPAPAASGALLCYALFGTAAVVALLSHGFPFAAPLMGIIGIAGLIVAYVKRDDAQGTWVASHLRWLIRTFWFSLLWGIIGAIIFVLLALIIIGIIIGYAIWVATTIWVLYRLVRGYMLFNESKPVPGM